jgi:hypothetical protein
MAAFSQPEIHAMCTAVDIVYRRLTERGYCNFSREYISSRVIACATSGERDPVRMADTVLSTFIEPGITTVQ